MGSEQKEMNIRERVGGPSHSSFSVKLGSPFKLLSEEGGRVDRNDPKDTCDQVESHAIPSTRCHTIPSA